MIVPLSEQRVYVGCSAKQCGNQLLFETTAVRAWKLASYSGWLLCWPTFYLDGEEKPRGTLRGFAELCPEHAAQLPPGASLGAARG